VLIKEMHHRVKNNLQVIASLLRLQSGTIADVRLQHAFDQSQSRVTSMALIHEKLYKGDELAHLDVTLYIEELFAELVRVNDVSDTDRLPHAHRPRGSPSTWTPWCRWAWC
jgi:two-component sensor histidine kinase